MTFYLAGVPGRVLSYSIFTLAHIGDGSSAGSEISYRRYLEHKAILICIYTLLCKSCAHKKAKKRKIKKLTVVIMQYHWQ
jgi:hypothetical protein